MIAGLSGSLLSHEAVERLVHGPGRGGLALPRPGTPGDTLRAWHLHIRDRLGPSSGPKAVFDVVADPLARALGFGVIPLAGGMGTVDALLQDGSGAPITVMIVTAWGQAQTGVWRHALRRGLAHGARWAICVSGTAVRIVDVERAYARRYAEFDLALALDDEEALPVFWGLLHATAVAPQPDGALLDRVVQLCERHRTEVRVSLREGVREALLGLVSAFRKVSRAHPDAHLLHESLIVIYRILFLLFAEARALVPTWHPVYKAGYTIDALRQQLERAVVPRGTWEALQAMARLAHRGCRAGALRVPPFNGRLFSPSDAPLADSAPLDDRIVGEALVALTTRKSTDGRERISYADLGVEQLGAVYEHLLDYDLAAGVPSQAAVLVPTGRRKATGSFYTPRSLTEFLVRRTMAPAVHEATPEQILGLRVLDPAMGSGAFLVAACRYLATAYEQALIDEGGLTPGDIGEDDRAGFRRAVAQRCLFGVDLNPMAVQLGRLSMWMATLSADRPLTFLDHHLRAGNSLVGGSIDDILRHPAPGRAAPRVRELPLFSSDELQSSLESAIGARLSIARTPDDTIEQVRSKERTLASLHRSGGALDRWRTAADIWCAAWFGPSRRGGGSGDRGFAGSGPGNRAPGRGMFRALLDQVMQDGRALPKHLADPLLAAANATAAEERFFHWTFEFPEVFFDERGTRLAAGGFDAIVGNPPWEMLRNEGGRTGTGDFSAFVRGSAVYRLQGHGHANLYSLFVERSLQLLKPGGRAGLILPSGFATDQASAALRRHFFDRTTVDTFTSLENRERIFPIHRSVKFLLMTLTNGGATAALPARLGVRSPDVLDRVPDLGSAPESGTIALPRPLIERISGESLAVPDIRSAADLEIVSSVAFRVPGAGDPAGWGIRFGRELNATDDRPHFTEAGEGLPIVEGKQLRAFGVDTHVSRFRIPARAAAQLLDAGKTFRRARLGYRDVASPANRTTLIAAIIPADVVTTHTVFCLKDSLDERSQHFLCGIFNSYVANYLVRMRVGTHVTTGIIARLPVPKPSKGDPVFQQVATLSRALAASFRLTSLRRGDGDPPKQGPRRTAEATGVRNDPRPRTKPRESDEETFARLNAVVAVLYGLSEVQFAHVLETFPLVAGPERAAALGMYRAKKV